MKKGYFISYLSGALAFGTALLVAGKTAKKYGQPVYGKKKLTLTGVANLIDSAVNMIEEIKPKTVEK